MKRGDHPQDQGRWRGNSFGVPTSIDRQGRQMLAYAVPTGIFLFPPGPYKSQLCALGVGTGPRAAMRFLRTLDDLYEDNFRHAMACVEAGDWEGPFEFIGNDPTRLEHDKRVREAFLMWAHRQFEDGHLESVKRKLEELIKAGHPLHEDEGRRIVAGVGGGNYQGYSKKYMLMHGSNWDPKAREESTLKKHFNKWRPVFFERALTQAHRYVGNTSGPAISVTNIWDGPL